MPTNAMVKERRVDPTRASATAPEADAAVVSMICLIAGVVLLSFLLGGPINLQDIGPLAGP
jgi:hypothetical protein